MRFLANENFPEPSIVLLRADGHDVRSVRAENPGSSDPQVIAFAQADERIILTFDKDYGELIFKDGIENPPAVLFLRYRGRDPKAAAALIKEAVLAGTVLEGRFTVIEQEGIRQRSY
jgi:predicted nuclease of predicted toxin-antitoxin system